MNIFDNPVLLTLSRGGDVESQHRGAIAVVAGDRVALAVGEIERPYFCRSAAKPFQAAPAVRAGVAEAFGLSESDVALLASSHSGESFHVEAVARLLRAGSLSAADLRCGTHVPLGAAAAAELARAGSSPTTLHHNCSGKHTGMLLFARVVDADPSRYLEPDHAIQTQIRAAVRDLCACTGEYPRVAIDGCSAPTFELPLVALARGYRALANPAAAAPEWRDSLARISAAMMRHPEMVAGTDRIDTELMRAGAGRLVSKIGYEGIMACGVAGEDIGIAIKIDDGAPRAYEALMPALLERLGLLGADARSLLARFRDRTLRNHAGIAVGEIHVAEF